jgi:hypothetical protein
MHQSRIMAITRSACLTSEADWLMLNLPHPFMTILPHARRIVCATSESSLPPCKYYRQFHFPAQADDHFCRKSLGGMICPYGKNHIFIAKGFGKISKVQFIFRGNKVIQSATIIYHIKKFNCFKIAVHYMHVGQDIFTKIDQQPFFNVKFVKENEMAGSCDLIIAERRLL